MSEAPTPAPTPSASPSLPIPSPRIPAHVVVALAIVYVVWSSTYLAIRVVVEELPPMGSGGVRYIAAGLCLLVFQRARGVALPTRDQWLASAPVGFLLFAIGNGLVATAERSIASGVAAVVCATMPLWAGVIGSVLGERASQREWLGMALGFAGVVVLLGGETRGDPLASLLLLLAPVGWALGSLWSRRGALAKGATGAATQMITGGASMLVIACLTGEAMPTTVSAGPLLSLVYLTLVGSVIAFSAYNHLLEHARPALAMSYAYVNPVIAVLLGAVLGAEHIGAEVVLATAMIVGAVFLLIRGRGGAR